MLGRICCVKNCRRRSHDHRGRRIPNGLRFYRFPASRGGGAGEASEPLRRRRRAAWVAAVGRSNITVNHIPSSMRVCSRHFRSGKPAGEKLESDPDWVPSLQLGHSDGNRHTGERLLLLDRNQGQAAEPGPPDGPGSPPREPEGPARPAVFRWRDVKSLLRQNDLLGKQPQEGPAAVKEVELSFRDFFRDALQASLEASSRSGAPSARPPSTSGGSREDPSLKPPPVKEENQTSAESSSSSSSSSSCCVNCVRLQRRIVELQEKLFCLSGEQKDMEASPVFTEAPPPPDQHLQSPETVHIKEEESEWMEPLSPPQDEDPPDESTPACSRADSQDKAPPERRRLPRFRQAWLKMFWFLRYSPSEDQMWCHVCRLHAGEFHAKFTFITGSRLFKMDSIKKHRDCKYHQDNVERHRLRMWLHAHVSPPSKTL
ncbi:uncharacterized protein [Pempheris klunzingeri]|uniref:uncharacterized protein n=1 Tax=Pempheris klunzingeri TaxID=3127111 RepID=UPI0039813CB6